MPAPNQALTQLTAGAGPLLSVAGLSVSLGRRRILSNIDLTVDNSQLVALLGPNGAGKSTLVRALAGEVNADRGQIQLQNKPLHSWRRPALSRHRAVMPQKVDLQFPLTTREVIALGRPRENARQRARVIDELLALLDITSLQHRLVPTLSGGEQQRVQLARVMAQIWDQPGPRLLLLDECSSALDPAHQQLIFQRLKQLAMDGAGLLVAVHDLNLAAQYADRLILMNNGQVFAEGDPGTVLTEENLARVYGLDARVELLPEGYPLVIPRQQSGQRPQSAPSPNLL